MLPHFEYYYDLPPKQTLFWPLQCKLPPFHVYFAQYVYQSPIEKSSLHVYLALHVYYDFKIFSPYTIIWTTRLFETQEYVSVK